MNPFFQKESARLRPLNFMGLLLGFYCLYPVFGANPEACRRYAAESVRQNEANLALKAGYTGPAWNSDFDYHYNWCVQGNNLASTPGHLADREKALQEFAIKASKDPARRYATESVRQNGQSEFMGAGFRPPVWSSDFNSHYNWCKQGQNVQTTPLELSKRERALQEFAIQHHKGPSMKMMEAKSFEVAKPQIEVTATPGKSTARTPLQRFNQLQAIGKGPDPMVAAFMHTLEKYLAGGSDFSPVEQIMLRGIMALPADRQHMLMNKWQQIPAQIRLAATPLSLHGLTAQSRLEMPTFVNSLVETAKATNPVKALQPDSMPQQGSQPSLIDRINQGQMAAFAPKIQSFSPMGPDGPFVRLGESFTLSGSNFGSNPQNTKVHFLQERQSRYELVGSVFPQALTQTELRATALAPALEPSNQATRIVIEVDGKFSAPFSITVAAGLQPTPRIDLVEPGAQYAGDMVLVSGANFGNPIRLFMQTMDQKASVYRPRGINFEIVPVALSNQQFQLQIPQDAWSGTYRFNIRSGNSGYSNYKTFEVLPPEFRVEFKTITCIDESDPEFGGSDEIVTSWVIISDNIAWTKGTGEYTDFDDGVKKDYTGNDVQLLPAQGKEWQTVRDFIYFRTTVYEWDSGDIKAWSDGMKAVGQISADVSQVLGTILGNPEAGKIAGSIIKAIGDGLAKLIDWIGNDPDLIGSNSLSWTAPELQILMSSSPIYSGTQLFPNSDENGSYSLEFNIIQNQ